MPERISKPNSLRNEGRIKKYKIDFGKAHTIYRNKAGKELYGVTTIIGILDKPQLVYWAYKKGRRGETLYEADQAAKVGTIAHERIKAYLKGFEIDEYNISKEAWDLSTNSLNSFKEWIQGQKLEILFLEKKFISEKYGYGGTIDLYGILNGQLTLIDFKSGKAIYESYMYQLAAYLQLLRERKFKVQRCICLNIPKSQDDTFMSYSKSAGTFRTQFKIFRNCLNIKILQSVEEKEKGGKVELVTKRRK